MNFFFCLSSVQCINCCLILVMQNKNLSYFYSAAVWQHQQSGKRIKIILKNTYIIFYYKTLRLICEFFKLLFTFLPFFMIFHKNSTYI